MRSFLIYRSFFQLGFLLLYGGFCVVPAQVTDKSSDEKPVAIKFLELRKMTGHALEKALRSAWPPYDESSSYYIINYGTNREIGRRERLIVSSDFFQGATHRARATFVRGGFAKGPYTVFWKVPHGAENPKP